LIVAVGVVGTMAPVLLSGGVFFCDFEMPQIDELLKSCFVSISEFLLGKIF